jgi:hypothetical protein
MVLAAALLAANLAGGGLLALLKAMDVAPLMGDPDAPVRSGVVRFDPGRPALDAARPAFPTAPAFAGLDPADREARRR